MTILNLQLKKWQMATIIFGTGIVSLFCVIGVFSSAAISLAIPIIERRSGLLGVISKEKITKGHLMLLCLWNNLQEKEKCSMEKELKLLKNLENMIQLNLD